MTAPSPFAALEHTFRLLATEPFAVAVDGRDLGCGLPRRRLPIIELRCMLIRTRTCGELHDRVIDVVLDRMRQQPALWVVVLGGLVLPGLHCRARQLQESDNHPGTLEVEVELLWEFAAALRRGPRHAHRLARDLLRLAQTSSSRHIGVGAGCCRRRAGAG